MQLTFKMVGYGLFVTINWVMCKLTTATTIPIIQGKYLEIVKRGFGFCCNWANLDEFHSAANKTKRMLTKF